MDDKRYPLSGNDDGSEDNAGGDEELEELASAQDRCTALRWHHQRLVRCSGGVDEDDPERAALYQRVLDDLERAHASVMTIYDIPATAMAPLERHVTHQPTGHPPRLDG